MATITIEPIPGASTLFDMTSIAAASASGRVGGSAGSAGFSLSAGRQLFNFVDAGLG